MSTKAQMGWMIVVVAIFLMVASSLRHSVKPVKVCDLPKNCVSKEEFLALEAKINTLQGELNTTKDKYTQLGKDFGVFLTTQTDEHKFVQSLDVNLTNITEQVKGIQHAIKDFSDSNKVVVETIYDTIGKLRVDLNKIVKQVDENATLNGQTKKWVIDQLAALDSRLKKLETQPHSIVEKKIYCVPKCN